MIGKLKGIIDSIFEDYLLIDVGGVCYCVFASAATLRKMPREGEAATLFIETHVREDHIHLFGFATENEKKAFRDVEVVWHFFGKFFRIVMQFWHNKPLGLIQ